MDKYRVTLTTEERVALEHLVSAGKAAARKLIHARALLLADTHGENSTDEDIVAALGTSPRTVSRVRQQLVTEGFDVALCRYFRSDWCRREWEGFREQERKPPRVERVLREHTYDHRALQVDMAFNRARSSERELKWANAS